jgi:hypothetical protein
VRLDATCVYGQVMAARRICGTRLANGGRCTKPAGCTDDHAGPARADAAGQPAEEDAIGPDNLCGDLLPVVQNLIDALEAFKQAIQAPAGSKP